MNCWGVGLAACLLLAVPTTGDTEGPVRLEVTPAVVREVSEGGPEDVSWRVVNHTASPIELPQEGWLTVTANASPQGVPLFRPDAPLRPFVLRPSESLQSTWSFRSPDRGTPGPGRYSGVLRYRRLGAEPWIQTSATLVIQQGPLSQALAGFRRSLRRALGLAAHWPARIAGWGWLLGIAVLILVGILRTWANLCGCSASYSQRLPQTRRQALLLSARARVALGIYRLWPAAARPRLALPAFTLYRWCVARGYPTDLGLASLKDALRIIQSPPRTALTPGGLRFQIHWALAENLQRGGPNPPVDPAGLAASIAGEYREAATWAGETQLEELCIALAEFFAALGTHLTSKYSPAAKAPAAAGTAVTRSIRWATHLLQALAHGGSKARNEAVRRLPADVPPTPLLQWVAAGASGWPPLPGGDRIEFAAAEDWRTLASRAECIVTEALRYGEGAAPRLFIPEVLFPRRELQRCTPDQRLILGGIAARLLAELKLEQIRLRRLDPHSEREKHPADWRGYAEAIAERVPKLQSLGEPGEAALGLASIAEHALVRGDQRESVAAIARIESALDEAPVQRQYLCAQARAHRVRGELYASCGDLNAGLRALNEGAAWSALLGDWVEWMNGIALRERARLDQLAQDGASDPQEFDVSIALLEGLSCSAELAFARRGWADLFHSGAVWGRFVKAQASGDVKTLAHAEVWGRPRRATRFGPPEIVLGHVVNFLIPRCPRLASLTNLPLTLFRSRRSDHTVLVMARIEAFARMTEEGAPLEKWLAPAERLLRRLDLAPSLVARTEAVILQARCRTGLVPKSEQVLSELVGHAVDGVNCLVAELEEAPTDALRRTAGVSRSAVIETLLSALSIAVSALNPTAATEACRRSYLALQGLRADDWENLVHEKTVASGELEAADLRRLQRLQGRLSALRDALAQSAPPAAAVAELRDLVAVAHELAEDPTVRGAELAMIRVQRQMAELLRRRSELAQVMAGANEDRRVTEIPPIPAGCVVVEYFRTRRQAGAFVLRAGGVVRYLSLPPDEIPDLNALSGSLVRSARAARRKITILPNETDERRPPEAQGAAGAQRSELEGFEEALAGIARTCWPEQLHRALEGSSRVCVVPWGDLWRVPFAALPSPSGAPLLMDKDVVVLPSIRFLSYSRPEGLDPARFAAAVYDAGQGTAFELTNLRAEIEYLRAHIPGGRVLEGREASPSAVLALLQEAQWVHIGCHGEVDLDSPLFSRLLLAPDAATPDGSFHLCRITEANEQLQGVFLAACESGLGQSLGDRPDTLAVCFLAAGARFVVGTLGEVYDEVAIRVVKGFYQAMLDCPPDAALCAALRTLAGGSEGTLPGSCVPLAHPAAWWPFFAMYRSPRS